MWNWEDGTPVDGKLWNRSEPNNWGGVEHCAVFSGLTGLMHDRRCYVQSSTAFGFTQRHYALCQIDMV